LKWIFKANLNTPREKIANEITKQIQKDRFVII